MAAPFGRCCLLKNVLKNYNRLCSANYAILPPSTLYPIREDINRFKRELPGDYKTWEQVQKDISSVEDTEPDIDIGAPYSINVDKRKVRKQIAENRSNAQLEQQARLNTYELPLDEVTEDYNKEYGPVHAVTIAKHYGIFEDLLPGAYFVPVINLDVCYDYDEETVTPVFTGNIITPSEASTAPVISFDVPDDSLWTLILTNPDGHLTDNNAEILHWCIGNIRGSDLTTGEELCDYIQPFPAKGTGYQRYVFMLFKQDRHLEYTEEQRSKNCTNLEERTFRTVDFYKHHAEHLTPMGLAFYQSKWDDSVRDVYHHKLNMREPVFEYDHVPHYRAVPNKFPKNQPFDRYFDRYRDQKDINEEVVRMKMNMISPFKEYKRAKYPLIHTVHRDRTKPTWLIKREELMHRRVDQFEDLPK